VRVFAYSYSGCWVDTNQTTGHGILLTRKGRIMRKVKGKGKEREQIGGVSVSRSRYENDSIIPSGLRVGKLVSSAPSSPPTRAGPASDRLELTHHTDNPRIHVSAQLSNSNTSSNSI
jgi:hypothetical protein